MCDWVKHFESQCLKYPDNTIVKYNGNNKNISLTYRSLNEKSNQLAHYLLNKGFTQQHIVATLFPRNDINALIVFIALLKINCPEFMLEPVLRGSIILAKIKLVNVRTIITTHYCKDKIIGENDEYLFLYYDDLILELEKFPKSNVNIKIEPSDIAFILSSSGTTGKAKIMKLPHCFIMDLCDSCKINGNNLLQLARKNFDACTYEYLIALARNMCLHFVDESVITDPNQFDAFFNHQISDKSFSFIITPTHIRTIISYLDETTATKLFQNYINSVQLVGEGFNLSLAKKLYKLGTTRVINAYGPTEAGISVSSAILFDRDSGIEEKLVYIGTPTRGTNIHILIKKNNIWQKCKTNERGFLCVCNSIRNVYIDNCLNDQKYFQYKGDTLFNTNDIAYVTNTGQIVIVGRVDNQLKISGQLVVTTEIEQVLANIANKLYPKHNNIFYVSKKLNTLVAYHISTNETDASKFIQSIRPKLVEFLEMYKIPTEYYWVKQFYKKVGGKLNIEKLKKDATLTRLIIKNSPQTKTEQLVAEQFAKIVSIPIETVDVCTPFEFMGCNSLLFMGFVKQCHTLFPDVVLNITAVKGKQNIRSLSKYIDEKPAVDLRDPDVLCKLIQQGSSTYPLFFTPPGDGLPLVYNKLSGLLGNKWTVYGFRIPGSNKGEEVLYHSVEEYATMFVNILITIQPDGPITLVGYCAGGTIAIEMAQQLKHNYNRDLAFVGMIDAPNPQQILEFENENAGIKTTFAGLFQINVEENYVCDTPEQLIDHLIDIGIQQNKLPHNQDRDFLKRFIKMEEITRDSIANYAPVVYADKVTYFKAEVSVHMPWMPQPRDKWIPFIPKLTIVQCRGSHLDMMKKTKECTYLSKLLLEYLL